MPSLKSYIPSPREKRGPKSLGQLEKCNRTKIVYPLFFFFFGIFHVLIHGNMLMKIPHIIPRVYIYMYMYMELLKILVPFLQCM